MKPRIKINIDKWEFVGITCSLGEWICESDDETRGFGKSPIEAYDCWLKNKIMLKELNLLTQQNYAAMHLR